MACFIFCCSDFAAVTWQPGYGMLWAHSKRLLMPFICASEPNLHQDPRTCLYPAFLSEFRMFSLISLKFNPYVLSVLTCIALCAINFSESCFEYLPTSVGTVDLLLLLLCVECYIWEDLLKFCPQDIEDLLWFQVIVQLLCIHKVVLQGNSSFCFCACLLSNFKFEFLYFGVWQFKRTACLTGFGA